MERPKIVMEHVSKEFKTRRQSILALDDINLHVYEREFISIIGPSGCGKSTIVRLLDDIIKPTSGVITVDGFTYTDKPVPKEIIRRIGFVFQHPNLLPWLTVRQNLLFPFEVFKDRDPRWKRVVDDLLEMANMTEYANYYPIALSGGMLQRIGTLRAMVYQPPILLMDEPYGALDDLLREQLDMETMRLWEALRQTIVLITHNVKESVFVSDRVYIMDTHPGRIIDEIKIDLPRPRTPMTTTTREFVMYTKYLTEKIGRIDLSLIK